MTNSHSIKITMSSPEEIGKAIQKQRGARKLAQKEFARRSGESGGGGQEGGGGGWRVKY